MHIVLALLGVIVTILVLLNRLSENGVCLGWLNPFSWKRRRDWSKKVHANPIYALDNPMDVTALIMVALAKSEGEISAEQKQEILKQFKRIFHLDEERAITLLTSSSFLLKDNINVIKQVDKLFDPSMSKFSKEQAHSSIELFLHISNFDNPINGFQQNLITDIKHYFKTKFPADYVF